MDSNFARKVRELIEQICNQQGLFFFNVSLHGKGNKKTIKVIVDTESGVTLKQCTDLNREINDLIYRKDLFEGNYKVEVSSPGTDKPLEEPYEYRRNIGRQLNISFLEGDIEKVICGELIEYTGKEIKLKIKDRINIVPVGQIKCAKVKLQW